MDSIKPPISPGEALIHKKVEELKSLPKKPEQLQKASEDFEALFIYFMLRSMRKTIVKSELLDSGLGGEIYESLFDQELSRTIAHQTRLGIAEMIRNQLSDNTGEETRSEAIQPLSMPVPALSKTIQAYLRNDAHSRLAPYETYIRQAARQYGVNENLVRAIIISESSGKPGAVSAAGAKGLMQLMDATARELGVKNVFNPQENIFGGTAYVSQLLKRFDGNVELALAAYNAGPSTVEKFGNIPPYKETRTYVQKVMRLYRVLSEGQ